MLFDNLLPYIQALHQIQLFLIIKYSVFETILPKIPNPYLPLVHLLAAYPHNKIISAVHPLASSQELIFADALPCFLDQNDHFSVILSTIFVCLVDHLLIQILFGIFSPISTHIFLMKSQYDPVPERSFVC